MREKREDSRIKKPGFLPGLDINWNGILKLPTYIWCNNKDNQKPGLLDTFFPKWKPSPKDKFKGKFFQNESDICSKSCWIY